MRRSAMMQWFRWRATASWSQSPVQTEWLSLPYCTSHLLPSKLVSSVHRQARGVCLSSQARASSARLTRQRRVTTVCNETRCSTTLFRDLGNKIYAPQSDIHSPLIPKSHLPRSHPPPPYLNAPGGLTGHQQVIWAGRGTGTESWCPV